MRQMTVISGHSIFTGFRRLTGCQRGLRDTGVTSSTYKTNYINTIHFLPKISRTYIIYRIRDGKN